MNDESACLEQEIAQLQDAIAVLAGMPDAQRNLRITLAQREQRLAQLRGLADDGPALPTISLIAYADVVQIVDGTAVTPYRSPFGLAKLADLLGTIRNALLAIASNLGDGHYTSNRAGTPELCAEALQTMAEYGYNLWQLLFAEPALRAFAMQLRERGMKTALQLNLITPGLVIPWHLIYDRDPKRGIVLDGFWGLRHVLMATPQLNMPVRFFPPVGTPFGALAGYYLPFAQESGDPQIIARQQALMQRLIPQAQLISNDAEFLEWMRSGSAAQLLYLFCHVTHQAPALAGPRLAEDRPTGAVSTKIILSRDGGITLHDLLLAAPYERMPLLQGHPLVILNACNSSAQSPLSDTGLVSFFFQHGAQALIGSECKVPVIFGDLFGEVLLEALCTSGQSVGTAIRTSRRTLIEQHNNPLGMLYSLLGRADVRLRV